MEMPTFRDVVSLEVVVRYDKFSEERHLHWNSGANSDTRWTGNDGGKQQETGREAVEPLKRMGATCSLAEQKMKMQALSVMQFWRQPPRQPPGPRAEGRNRPPHGAQQS